MTKMAKTDEHELCEQFVKKQLNELKLRLDQCTKELTLQSESCPTTLLPWKGTLDQKLKDFVEIQQKYLSNKMNCQLARYQNRIHEKELFQILSTFTLTSEQVACVNLTKKISELLHFFRFCFSCLRKIPWIDF